MTEARKSFGVLFVVLVVALYFSITVITEGHRGLILRWGKIVSDNNSQIAAIVSPGLYYQIPLFYQIRSFDMRLRTWVSEASAVMTADKQTLMLHNYVKWRITDLPRYFTAASGQEQRAQALFSRTFQTELQTQINAYPLSVLLQDREKIMGELRERLKKQADELGIELLDIQLTRLEPANIDARMQTAQTRFAEQRRAEGKANVDLLRTEAETGAALILAKAKEKAAEIRGAGDAEAAKRYADAYGKNPEFYSFYRSMEAYKKVFAHDHSILVIKPEGQFFKYFNYHPNQEKK